MTSPPSLLLRCLRVSFSTLFVILIFFRPSAIFSSLCACTPVAEQTPAAISSLRPSSPLLFSFPYRGHLLLRHLPRFLPSPVPLPSSPFPPPSPSLSLSLTCRPVRSGARLPWAVSIWKSFRTRRSELSAFQPREPSSLLPLPTLPPCFRSRIRWAPLLVLISSAVRSAFLPRFSPAPLCMSSFSTSLRRLSSLTCSPLSVLPLFRGP